MRAHAFVIGLVVMHSFAFTDKRQRELCWHRDGDDDIAKHMGYLALPRTPAGRRSRASRAPMHFPIVAAALFASGPIIVPCAEHGLTTELRSRIMRALRSRHTTSQGRIFESVRVRGVADESLRGLSFDQLVQRWFEDFGVRQRHRDLRLWPVWSPLAEIMARGGWPSDCTRVALRLRQNEFLQLLPNQPPRQRLVQHLESCGVDPEETKPVLEKNVVKYKSTHRGSKRSRATAYCVKSFDPDFLIRAIRASRRLLAMEDLPSNVEDIVNFAFPELYSDLMELFRHEKTEVPTRWTLTRGRVKLDAASMLVQRREHRQPHESLWRYLTFDASPKGGMEIFAVKEMIVKNADRRTSEWRHLPLLSLGHGHCGALDKTVAIAHACFLVAGPGVEQMRRWCSSVRWCLTDSGPEMLAVDMPDLAQAFVNHRCGLLEPQFLEECDGTHMFPLALRGPGWNHCWDNVVKSVCTTAMPFYSGWQTKARGLCVFMRNTNYREKLKIIGRSRGLQADSLKLLDKTAPSFAKWRWNTLSRVAKYLTLVRRTLIDSWDGTCFRLKDATHSKLVHGLMTDTAFWQQCAAIAQWISAVDNVRTWGQGCPCHEQQCVDAAKKSKIFMCPSNAKSCRGPELLSKLRATWQTWTAEALRTTARTDDGDPNLCETMGTVWRATVAESQIRFGFAEKLPWLLWRCRDRMEAKRAAEVYQQDVAKFGEGMVHRVSRRFFGDGGEFQEAMQAHINGAGINPALDLELQAYEGVPLDETYAEASHRDVHRFTGHATAGRLAWWSSTQRLSQNLQLYDAQCCLRADLMFHDCMRSACQES